MDTLLQDVKFAVRQLWKDKGFLLTAVITLALCIGANAAIFSVIDAVLLEPLPFPESDRLVTLWNAYPGATGGDVEVRGSNSAPDYFDRRGLDDVFEGVANYSYQGASIEIDGTPQRVTARGVTPSFFSLLRAEAAVGRTFTEQEGEPGDDRVAILGHGLWQELYAGDPSVVGRELRVDGRPRTIVGVMPRDFAFIDDDVRLWVPIAYTQEQRQQYHNNSWQQIARLQPGVSLARAQERIDALNAATMDRFPQIKPLLIDAGFHTPVHFLEEDLVRDVSGVLYMLWGGVGFVLLIGCVNVANLVLVRSTARSQELATRFALGARRRRVVQQLLTESVMMTLLGGAVGLLLGWAGIRGLDLLGLQDLPRGSRAALDGTTVAFTLLLTVVVGVLVGLIPVARVMGMSLSSVFREEGRGGTASRGLRLLRKGLVAGQVALALVLLAGAGLLVASFQQLLSVDPGFEPEGVLTGIVVPDGNRYPEDSDLVQFADRLLGDLRALPGVETVGITNQIPFGSGFSDSVIFAEGYVMQEGESAISPSRNVVTPGYFEAMGIEVVRGRAFDGRDTADGRPVIVIDQRLADRFWPEGNALGKRMWRPTSVEEITNPENAEFFDIVGVVETIRLQGLSGEGEPPGSYYFPWAQQPQRGMDLAIRGSVDPRTLIGPVRRVVAEADPQLPLFDIHTMPERIAGSLGDRRTPMLLTAGFSAVALVLAAVGIFGVLAYLVQLRSREIGIRMALGGDAGAVFRLVLAEGAVMLAVGLLVGLAGAAGLRRLIESQLYGVSALDPVVLAGAVAVLSTVALVACALPARRATRIDPVEALARE